MIRLRKHGFTLVELMIVVAIIGVLAVVAGTAYRRYMDSGRTAEAMAMLGEIRAKEEAYRAEFSTYTGWGNASGGEAAANTLPVVDGGCSVGSKEPCAKALPASGAYTGNWAYWQALGINANKNMLYCGYIVNADAAGKAVSGTIGSQLLGTGAQTTPWWYAIAMCDNDGTAGTNATFATAFNTTVVSAQNEHK